MTIAPQKLVAALILVVTWAVVTAVPADASPVILSGPNSWNDWGPSCQASASGDQSTLLVSTISIDNSGERNGTPVAVLRTLTCRSSVPGCQSSAVGQDDGHGTVGR